MLGKTHLFYGVTAGAVLALALAHPAHSWLLAEAAVAYAVTAPLLGPWAAVGFCAGYLSHLAGDGCTRAGIPLVPYTAARLHLLPPLLRIRTGSAGEAVFTATYVVALAAVVYVFLARDVTLLVRSELG